MKPVLKNQLLILTVGWFLIVIHYLIFNQFFPNAQGKLGHDHAYNLPLLLDGYYWFLNNGFFSVPWFTPSFCGGMPLLANPATFYISAAQFFSFLIDPLSSLKLTFVMFAALGFWGFYWLLNRVFHTHVWTAILGGTLFLFNGLYAHRFIIGHIEFHAYMLVPLLAFLLLKSVQTKQHLWKWHLSGEIVASALLISYMFLSGMTQLIIPSMISVILIGLILGILVNSPLNPKWFFIKFSIAGMLSLCLSAAKLVGALSFLSHFPRDAYLLPGVEGIFKLLFLIGEVLSVGGSYVNTEEILTNSQWLMTRHEFEYGITLVPFILIGLGALLNAHRARNIIKQYAKVKPGLYLFFITLLLMIPLMLNYYSPEWNQVLKNTPVIKSLTNFLRWFNIYILIFILLAAIVVEKTKFLRQYRLFVAIASIAFIIIQTITTEREFYHKELYNSQNVVTAHTQAKMKNTVPSITHIAANLDSTGRPQKLLHRNNALTQGYSQLFCYEPMFGFDLEFFPFKMIRLGPTLSEHNGLLNIKNPACYLYPEENQCEPGDHFRADQKADAENFINFRPFHYEISSSQKIANTINLISLLIVICFGGIYGFLVLRPRGQNSAKIS